MLGPGCVCQPDVPPGTTTFVVTWTSDSPSVRIRTWWVGLRVFRVISGTPDAVTVVEVKPELGVANAALLGPRRAAAMQTMSPPSIKPHRLRSPGLALC